MTTLKKIVCGVGVIFLVLGVATSTVTPLQLLPFVVAILMIYGYEKEQMNLKTWILILSVFMTIVNFSVKAYIDTAFWATLTYAWWK